MKKKVVIGMSGGIDSSVTAYMLQKEGYEVEGVYMKLHDLENYHEANIQTGQKVARFLGIKFHVLDISSKFKTEVYDYFVQSYLDGITPNPCVKCNRIIKFGVLFDFAKSIKADFIATGHYAKTDGKFIYEAEDKTKDQSYFLAQIKKEILPHIMFPMSKFKKEDIITLGANLNDVFKEISQKKESQEICFVETVYTDILKKHANIDKPGIVLNEQGKEVGIHKGYMHYTIGKRRGFNVNGAHAPHFVKEISPQNNTIVVGLKESLKINTVYVENLNMFIKEKNFEAGVKLRYRSATTPCKVELLNDNEAMIQLHEPVYGVACGQVAVFYEGNKVVGSGWITKTLQ